MIDRFNNQNCNYCAYNTTNNNNNNDFDDDECFGTTDSSRLLQRLFRRYLRQSNIINNISCPINNSNLSLAVRLAFLTDLFIFFKRQILTLNELPNIHNIITYHSQIGGSLTVLNSLVSKVSSFIAGPSYATSNIYVFDNYFNTSNGLLNNSSSINPAVISLAYNNIPSFEYIIPPNVNIISNLTITVYPNINIYPSVSLGISVAVFIKRAASSSFVITTLQILVPSSQIPTNGSAIFINSGSLSVSTCDVVIIVANAYIDFTALPLTDGTYTYSGSLPGSASFQVN